MPDPMDLAKSPSRKLQIVIEKKLHSLKNYRLEEQYRRLGNLHSAYIPIQAKPNLEEVDQNSTDLMDQALDFLHSDRQVFLVLGDSGSGKSSFSWHLESELLKSYCKGGRIPLYINLPDIKKPGKELVKKYLKFRGFDKSHIQEMKEHRQFVLICDGYDEARLTRNLYSSNDFNKPGQWKVKIIINCRCNYLRAGYEVDFIPPAVDRYNTIESSLFQQAVIVPFSDDDVKAFIDNTPREPISSVQRRIWSSRDYLDKIAEIPDLMGLLKNPFLLSISLEFLPSVIEEASGIPKFTRLILFDKIIRRWIQINEIRLSNIEWDSDFYAVFLDFREQDFAANVMTYLKKLAFAIFINQAGRPIVRYIHKKHQTTWKMEFFSPMPHATVMREASPLTSAGARHRFIHHSLLDYFHSLQYFDPNSLGKTLGLNNNSDSSNGNGGSGHGNNRTPDGNGGGHGNSNDGHDARLNNQEESQEPNDSSFGGGAYSAFDMCGRRSGNNQSTSREGNGENDDQSEDKRGNSEEANGTNGRSPGSPDDSNGSSDGESDDDSGSTEQSSQGSDNVSRGDSFDGSDTTEVRSDATETDSDDSDDDSEGGYPTATRNSIYASTSADPFDRCNLFNEPSTLQFLVERLQDSNDFKDQLLSRIEHSKAEVNASVAAANAITILIKAGITLLEEDLAGVRVPGWYLAERRERSTHSPELDSDVTGWHLAMALSGHRYLSGTLDMNRPSERVSDRTKLPQQDFRKSSDTHPDPAIISTSPPTSSQNLLGRTLMSLQLQDQHFDIDFSDEPSGCGGVTNDDSSLYSSHLGSTQATPILRLLSFREKLYSKLRYKTKNRQKSFNSESSDMAGSLGSTQATPIFFPLGFMEELTSTLRGKTTNRQKSFNSESSDRAGSETETESERDSNSDSSTDSESESEQESEPECEFESEYESATEVEPISPSTGRIKQRAKAAVKNVQKQSIFAGVTTVVLIGNRGVGKSTLLNVLGGTFESGFAMVDGLTQDVTTAD
ncbi:hypothetical protein BGZ96_001693, partial [Linnemannia gamsii]